MSAKQPHQIFVVGMNGSGTTMLLDHLSSHSLIFGFPAETRFLPYYILNQARFGDLGNDRNFEVLWREMSRHLIVGDSNSAEREELAKERREAERSAAGVFDAHISWLARMNGKPIWCEKTPMHVHHVGRLAAAFPRAKFIHIIRDGRDCAASFHRRWGYNPVRSIYRWKNAVRSGRAQGRQVGERYLEVRYEALTCAAESAFKDMCTFLDVPFEAAMLHTARVRSALLGSGSKTIAATGNKATRYFSSSMLKELENVAGAYLTELGYACLDKTGDRDPPGWLLRVWEMADDMRRLGGLVGSSGRLMRPRTWPNVANRVRRMLKQKRSLRPR